LDLEQKYMEIWKHICDGHNEIIKKIPFLWKTIVSLVTLKKYCKFHLSYVF